MREAKSKQFNRLCPSFGKYTNSPNRDQIDKDCLRNLLTHGETSLFIYPIAYNDSQRLRSFFEMGLENMTPTQLSNLQKQLLANFQSMFRSRTNYWREFQNESNDPQLLANAKNEMELW